MSTIRNRTVLLVEDEWLVRMEFADCFASAGWKVLEAASAEEGIEILAAIEAIDVLVTDIRLTGPLTGWDLAKAAREKRSALPVIYVSGNTIDEDRMVPDSLFLEKPARTERVLQAAMRLMAD